MTPYRMALANLRFPSSREESVALAEHAITEASAAGAGLVAFPECYVPGYRAPDKRIPAPDAAFLERAWSTLAAACAKAKVVAVVGTERVIDDRLRITALVIDADGVLAGFQDKVQLDPSEERTYAAASGRRLFRAGPLTFGIAICHEGFRYPETVRWAARRGAQLVLHPHFHEAEPGGHVPTAFADPRNTFHEKAMLCRAAENNCWIATINVATAGSPTTSAVIRPDGTLLTYQPYGRHGLLVGDIDLEAATCILASRCKIGEYSDR
jgi:predicted amidohydrolase